MQTRSVWWNVAVHGCGIPVLQLALKYLPKRWGRLAQGNLMSTGDSLQEIGKHPFRGFGVASVATIVER
jgi:L-asparaginase II